MYDVMYCVPTVKPGDLWEEMGKTHVDLRFYWRWEKKQRTARVAFVLQSHGLTVRDGAWRSET
jgi:hypothetical protein